MNLEKLKGHIPDRVIAQIPDTMQRFELNTPLRLAHFLAQTGHESGGFKATTENLNYGAKGLLNIFKKYFPTEAKAKEYDGKIASTQVKLDAAKVKYAASLAKGAAYAKATEQWNNAIRSYERAIAGFKRAADNWREKSSDVTAQQKRLELQSQTIAASEVEIKSNLQGRNQACRPGL